VYLYYFEVRKMAIRSLLAVLVFLFVAPVQLLAATLNFDSHPPGVATAPLRFPDVLISHGNGGALFVYGTGDFGMPVGGAVCGLQTDFTCTGDVSLLFIGAVSDLKFSGFDASISDKATISAYSDDYLLSVLLISGTSDGKIDIDFTGVSGITRIEIADHSSTLSRGIAYGSFVYDPDPPGPPPPPKPPVNFLSFDAFLRGANEETLDLGQAILREIGGGKIFVYQTGDYNIPQNGALCAFQASTCMGEFQLDFKQPVFDLVFSGFFAKITDSSIISLYDGNRLIYSDFSDAGKLTRVLFTDASNVATKGIAYGDFKYRLYTDPVVPPAVPLPATAILLLAGLTLLSVFRTRALRPIHLI
jgi:hypothetical protein